MATVVSSYHQNYVSAPNSRGTADHFYDLMSVETDHNCNSAHGTTENFSAEFLYHNSRNNFFAGGVRAKDLPFAMPANNLISYPNYVSSCDAWPYSRTALNQSSTLTSFENDPSSTSQCFSSRRVGTYPNYCNTNQFFTNCDVRSYASAQCRSGDEFSCAPVFGRLDLDRGNQSDVLSNNPSDNLIDNAWIIGATDSMKKSAYPSESLLDEPSTDAYSSDDNPLAATIDEVMTASGSRLNAGVSAPSSFPKQTPYDFIESSEPTPSHTRVEETPAEYLSWVILDLLVVF